MIKEFLERQKEANPVAALAFLMDLLTLLDELGDEKCSVLAGKIRAQIELEKGSRELTDSDLVDLCTFADKLDATGHEVYALQFDEHLNDLMRETGLSIPEIKNRAREYRKQR